MMEKLLRAEPKQEPKPFLAARVLHRARAVDGMRKAWLLRGYWLSSVAGLMWLAGPMATLLTLGAAVIFFFLAAPVPRRRLLRLLGIF